MKYSAVVLVLSVLLLAACGQKGPLYLPGNAPTQQNTPAAQSEQTPAATDNTTE